MSLAKSIAGLVRSFSSRCRNHDPRDLEQEAWRAALEAQRRCSEDAYMVWAAKCALNSYVWENGLPVSVPKHLSRVQADELRSLALRAVGIEDADETPRHPNIERTIDRSRSLRRLQAVVQSAVAEDPKLEIVVSVVLWRERPAKVAHENGLSIEEVYNRRARLRARVGEAFQIGSQEA